MNNSKTSLFLMELIIVILFFSLCGAVCVQLFFNTHSLDQSTSVSSKATLIEQNLCEVFLSGEGNTDTISEIIDSSWSLESELLIAYDESGNALSQDALSKAVYLAVISSDYTDYVNEEGVMIHGNISVYSPATNQKISPSITQDDISQMNLISTQELEYYKRMVLEAQ